MEEIVSLFKQLWTVWLVLLFAGICVWAFWPSRRREMERHARIPLEDENGDGPKR
ncbi:cbb3-type cytochrome c oxidase subunit 3 [Geminicoccaceae bacterium 1502E]|nr:cbb3-type cytochrome c oxidase subunit 3 [Geminicoccaceae bacterium 1502E]